MTIVSGPLDFIDLGVVFSRSTFLGFRALIVTLLQPQELIFRQAFFVYD